MIIRFLLTLTLFCGLFVNVVNSQPVNLYIEDFETDGNNSRYFMSHQFYDFALASYFGRGTLAQLSDLPAGIGGLNGSFLVGAEDVDRSVSGPSNGIVSYTTRAIQVDSFSQVVFGFKLGARSANNYDFFTGSNRDFVDVDFRFDGGAWTRLMQFRNGPLPNTNSQRLYRDNDFDNLGGDQAQDSILSESMTVFNDTILVTGDIVEFRIRLRSNSSGEEIFFDQIVIQGIPVAVIPPTLNRMLYQYMGYTTDNLQDNLWCTINGSAIAYEFEISGTGFTTQNIVNTTNKFNLTEVPGMTYNRTYNLRHRIITAGGPGVWSDDYYGLWTINVLPAAVPQVSSTQCGGTINLLNDKINFNRIGNATNYRVNVTGPNSFSVTDTLNTTNNEFTLAGLGATEAGVYQVQVSAFVDGAWQAFTTTCNVTLATLTPQISILNADCGGIVTNMANLFYAEDVPNTEFYQWRIRGDGSPIAQLSAQTSDRKMRISDLFPSATYGETYTLDVRYRVNGSTAPFGPDCIITLNAPVLTIRKPTCGSIITDSLTQIWTTPVDGATYEFSVYNTFFDTLISSISPFIVFNQLNETFDLSTINVSVRPIIGVVPSTFGDTCSFTYSQARMASGAKLASVMSTAFETNLSVYPNPTKDLVHLSGNLEDISEIIIVNSQGKRVIFSQNKINEEIDLNLSDLSSGVYILQIYHRDGGKEFVRIHKL